MKTKILYTILMSLLVFQNLKAQSKDEEAQLKYEMAQEEYDKGNYQQSIQYLDGVEKLSEAAKVKTSYLKARCYQKLLFTNSTPDALYTSCLNSIQYYLDNGKDEEKRKELLKLRIKVADALESINKANKKAEQDEAERKKAEDAERKRIAEEVSKGYLTVGNKVWSIVNLDVSTFNDGRKIGDSKAIAILVLKKMATYNLYNNKGSKITEAESETKWWNENYKHKPAWCYYNGDPNNSKYGKLYNKYAATDKRGLAPPGWHIPTNEELRDLEEHLKNDSLLTAAWNKNGIGGTVDLKGAGSRNNPGDFLPSVFYFHTSTTAEGYNHLAVDSQNGSGAFIRCVKD